MIGWSPVINMSFSEGASFLVRAMEHDKEAVPGLQEHSQLFWCISRRLAVLLLLPSLKGSLPHPVTERFPPEKAKIVPSFIYKEEQGGKEEVTENKLGQKNKPQSVQQSQTKSVNAFRLTCSVMRDFEHFEVLFCHHK